MAHRDPSPTAHRRLLLGGIVLLLVPLGAGCAKGSSGSGNGGTADSDLHAQGVRFSECMRANGISDFPDPDASGDFDYGISVSAEVWTSTLAACEDLQPAGTFSADRSTEQQSAALRFAECIRDHGVEDFPDPVNGEPLVDTYKIPSSDSADGMKILNAAMEACGDIAQEALVKP